MARIRHLVVVLGDQLYSDSPALGDLDANRDLVWMAEVQGESTHVPSHKVRTALFLTCMRHFADGLRRRKLPVEYHELDEAGNSGTLAGELRKALNRHQPTGVVMVEPGEYRLQEELRAVCEKAGVPLEIRPDEHFFCSREEFRAWAEKQAQLRMEFFYREMRKKTGYLMERTGKPVGGQWNYDVENRKSFGKAGPPTLLATPKTFKPDAITREVLALVDRALPKNPGALEHFDFPVTEKQAEEALKDFVKHRLADFGNYQDAMWTDEPYLFHARISAMMNLKFLNPRKVLGAVQEAYESGDAPLAAVEGFVRQILGWREYIRGVYWWHMPEYLNENALGADQQLPDFYWTGDTDMECLRQAVGQTLQYGYAHHIQRLMVTGLFSLLFAVNPVEIHKWYLAIYWDAIEWVELPNVLGMSQYADGGLMASKPYVATGKYINRMSNYCSHCRYKPDVALGDDACPFTLLYWDFLIRHETMLAKNQRMRLQVRNVERINPSRKTEILQQAQAFRDSVPKGRY